MREYPSALTYGGTVTFAGSIRVGARGGRPHLPGSIVTHLECDGG